ncbi:sulfotransferase [Asticcacaulis sp.]|uniref:sulfotransferase n=1 Tax=Asticcacaulis sp. TaxID=1872648 RepID=UPI0026229CD0|nr:sulfotransferase [Asticcacaulis sp.]
MNEARLNAPIFLMCSERSGSNLLSRMFAAHPHICGPGAAHLFRVFSEVAAHYGEDELPALRRDMLDMFEAKFGLWQIDAWPRARREAVLQTQKSAAGMVAALYEAERRSAGRDRIFVKECSIHGFLPFLESVSDAPAYVFMVRDPRDMALSWLRADALRGGVVRAARQWMADQTSFVNSLAWLKGRRRLAVLTYEALLADPERVLAATCARLGMGFDPAMLDFSANARAEAARAHMLRNIGRPLMCDNHGQYRQGLDAEQIAYVEAVCAPLMAMFGYVPDLKADDLAGHDGFAALEAAVLARDPWDKPQYLALPSAERQRYENWSRLRDELRRRPITRLAMAWDT